jgi:acetyl esterase/lipase
MVTSTHPALSLRDDPRTDPRIVRALRDFSLDINVAVPPVTASSPRDELLRFGGIAEASFREVLRMLAERLPEVEGVSTEVVTVSGPDGNALELHIHRPDSAPSRPAPCVVHLHGGAMVMLSAADRVYRQWRDELAAGGLVVIGVEFRNGAGELGPHPFPAGLRDAAAAARWAAANLAELGCSHLVLSGESGGGTLALALPHLARREGWLDEIGGVYAQCPYISGAWDDPPAELPSMVENDGYFISCALFSVFMEIYDPGGEHRDDPLCWPLRASAHDLEAMPRHAISVNELDLLRDEGLAYYRALRDSGVPCEGRVVPGTSHAADVLLANAIPDVHAASLRDVISFAHATV